MISFILFTSFVFVAGYLLGVHIGIPELFYPRPPKPSLPIAWAMHLAETNRPAVYRRKSKRIINVEAE